MLVSALIADGPPNTVLAEADRGRLELVLPDLVLDELERVLRRKLGWEERAAARARELLVEAAAQVLTTPASPPTLTGSTSDDAILASAVEAGADVLVTGDRRHLLPFGEHAGVRLMTPQALLAELAADD